MYFSSALEFVDFPLQMFGVLNSIVFFNSSSSDDVEQIISRYKIWFKNTNLSKNGCYEIHSIMKCQKIINYELFLNLNSKTRIFFNIS